MKIAFYSTNDYVPWGGSEELWYQTAMVLLGNGHEIWVCVKYWEVQVVQIENLKQKGAKIIFRHRHYIPSKISVKQRIKNKFTAKQPPTVESFSDLLNYVKLDLVIISTSMYESVQVMEQCHQQSVRYTCIIHVVSEFFYPDDEISYRFGIGLKHSQCNFILCNKNAELIEKQTGMPLNNVQFFMNPYNIDYNTQYQPIEQNDRFMIACVARLDVIAKGQDILFEVLKMEKWKQRNLHISFYGNGANRQLLERLANLLRIKNITFAGFVTDISQIWKNHSAIILPSRFEGLPLGLIEAMLSYRFGIVTDVAGNATYIEDNVNGFIAKYPYPEFIDEAMERAWQRRMEWNDIGKKAGLNIRKYINENPVLNFANTILTI